MGLILRNITKKYKSEKILNNISFEVKENEIFGIIGSNGAGKSTLLKVIALLENFSGEMDFLNYDTNRDMRELKKNLGVLIETPTFYEQMTGREFLNIVLAYKGQPNYHININDLPFKMGDFIDKRIKSYSMGMKQKLGIITATINSPRFIILDEPHNFLDPVSILELREYLMRLKLAGSTLIVSSHNIGEIIKVCDSVVVIDSGEVRHTVENKEILNLENILIGSRG